MIYIKEWFFNKLKSEHRNLHFFYGPARINKETEKAFQVFVEYTTIDGEYEGEKLVWVPKSCTMTREEYLKEEAEAEKRFEDGKAAYDNLVAWAKENGVKGVRVGMRKTTILEKIEKAGLTYPETKGE